MIFLDDYKTPIIDMFEEFLEDHNITIWDGESEDNDPVGVIHSSDFEYLSRRVDNTLFELAIDAGAKRSEIVNDRWG